MFHGDPNVFTLKSNQMLFTKHPEEKNKDLVMLQKIENQWLSKEKCLKYYHRAAKRALPTQYANNKNAVALYHIAIKKIKEYHAALPSKIERIVVEMDLRPHPTAVDTMHSILFPTCYFDLCCDVWNNVYISYKLDASPLQSRILGLFKRIGLLHYCRADTNIKDYKEFFKSVLRVQPEKFITLL